MSFVILQKFDNTQLSDRASISQIKEGDVLQCENTFREISLLLTNEIILKLHEDIGFFTQDKVSMFLVLIGKLLTLEGMSVGIRYVVNTTGAICIKYLNVPNKFSGYIYLSTLFDKVRYDEVFMYDGIDDDLTVLLRGAFGGDKSYTDEVDDIRKLMAHGKLTNVQPWTDASGFSLDQKLLFDSFSLNFLMEGKYRDMSLVLKDQVIRVHPYIIKIFPHSLQEVSGMCLQNLKNKKLVRPDVYNLRDFRFSLIQGLVRSFIAPLSGYSYEMGLHKNHDCWMAQKIYYLNSGAYGDFVTSGQSDQELAEIWQSICNKGKSLKFAPFILQIINNITRMAVFQSVQNAVMDVRTLLGSYRNYYANLDVDIVRYIDCQLKTIFEAYYNICVEDYVQDLGLFVVVDTVVMPLKNVIESTRASSICDYIIQDMQDGGCILFSPSQLRFVLKKLCDDNILVSNYKHTGIQFMLWMGDHSKFEYNDTYDEMLKSLGERRTDFEKSNNRNSVQNKTNKAFLDELEAVSTYMYMASRYYYDRGERIEARFVVMDFIDREYGDNGPVENHRNTTHLQYTDLTPPYIMQDQEVSCPLIVVIDGYCLIYPVINRDLSHVLARLGIRPNVQFFKGELCLEFTEPLDLSVVLLRRHESYLNVKEYTGEDLAYIEKMVIDTGGDCGGTGCGGEIFYL